MAASKLCKSQPPSCCRSDLGGRIYTSSLGYYRIWPAMCMVHWVSLVTATST